MTHIALHLRDAERRFGRLTAAFVAGLVLVVAAVGSLVITSAPAGAASTPPPSVLVSPGAAAPGAIVTVTGSNFPANTNVQVQICGNQALDGSNDCDPGTSQEVSTTSSGLFSLQMLVAIPPKPCPCVILVLNFSSSVTPTTPFQVIGAPYSTPTPVFKIHPLKVLSASLSGSGPWTSWFGAPPKRTLVLTVHNPNPTPYLFPPLVLAVGQDKDLTTLEATTQRLDTIDGDKTETYDIPVSFPAFSVGEHQVVGKLGNAGTTVRFQVGTWLMPWGLVLIVLIVLELIALAITRYFRERRRRKDEQERAALAPPPSSRPPVLAAAAVAAAAGNTAPVPIVAPVPEQMSLE